MASSAGEAFPISVEETVRDNRVSEKTRIAHGYSIAKPRGQTAGRELVSAGEEKHEQDSASEAQGSPLWRALDKLLRTSFGAISPPTFSTRISTSTSSDSSRGAAGNGGPPTSHSSRGKRRWNS
jgi:hypothetical protein